MLCAQTSLALEVEIQEPSLIKETFPQVPKVAFKMFRLAF